MTMLTSEACHLLQAIAAHHLRFQNSDRTANALTAFLVYGLFISYVPQHLRIIRAGTSIGLSPWFLLLGSTSSAAAMLNMITMQWPILRCCKEVSFGKCIEISAGVLQVSTQWLLFTIIMVLFILYYPANLKYVELEINTHDLRPIQRVRSSLKSDEWRLSVIVSWAVAVHLAFIVFTTFFLLFTTPLSADPTAPRPRQVELWAAFLGVSSGVLAAIQYAPQLQRTYALKLVGALSIPMMIIQSPGGIVMAVSIAIRPGTNWTSWIMYIVSAVMQTCLLLMCFAWKMRQRKLGIDDFGRPLDGLSSTEDRGGAAVTEDVAEAEAVDVRVIEGLDGAGEDTPLLKPAVKDTKQGGILGWLVQLRR
ncbi:hypothetical protein ID866_8934 [Astraeus odoratus]|nr:hypothetical protein ID866_8934 [Astraeus odoratus]